MNNILLLNRSDEIALTQIHQIYSSHTGKDFFQEHPDDIVYYLNNKQEVLSFICLKPCEHSILLTGFTDKNHQNRGFFTELYQFILSHRAEILAIWGLFYTEAQYLLDIKTTDDNLKIRHLTEKFNWTHRHSNLFFCKDLEQMDEKENVLKKYRIRYSYLRKEYEHFRKYIVFCKKRKIAEFALSDLSDLNDGTVFFHSFDVTKKYRRQGHGFRIMLEIMFRLKAEYKYLYLHVFADNLPAICLYRKLNFNEIDKYDYYEGFL